MLGDDVVKPGNFSREVGDSSSVLTNWKHPEKIVDRRLPDKSLDASSTLDFGKNDGRAARGTGIRLSPTFCKQKIKMVVSARDFFLFESREDRPDSNDREWVFHGN